MKVRVAVYILTPRVLEQGLSPAEAMVEYRDPASGDKLTADEMEQVEVGLLNEKLFRDAYTSACRIAPAIVTDPEEHVEWYRSWLSTGPSTYYWTRLKEFVAGELKEKFSPEIAGTALRGIDEASDAILSQMEHPERTAFASKGLVVGHVQSGKTANFTAVIAKAVDAGYRLFIVFSGIHNSLRNQTQLRLDRELTGEPEFDNVRHVEVPLLERHRWVRLTSVTDFSGVGKGRLDTLSKHRSPILAVVKKNTTVMRALLKWLERARPESRRILPTLVIDDEADLASIDVRKAGAEDPSATNHLLRSILRLFPRCAYIGYTATPFANVLVDLETAHPEIGRDLYPRNFVVALPRPERYFGAERIFSRGDGPRYARLVPEAEVQSNGRARRGRIEPDDLPDSLREAVHAFVLAGAARAFRGEAEQPATMLVHTTRLVAGHRRVKADLEECVESLKARWVDECENAAVDKAFRQLWNTDFIRTSESLGDEFPRRVHTYEEIAPYIGGFLDEIQVMELNSRTEDKLDYASQPSLKVLAVGGNTLSRGLTLEGLTTSYYLRYAQAYDTLLQMGRWFGYRDGYEDLTRVYTSATLMQWFEDLALVEQELRDEIYRYEDEGLTPLELPVRIRAHRDLRVTAPNKMGAAKTLQHSFSRSLRQTIWFPLDRIEALKRNLHVTDLFLSQLKWSSTADERGYLARKIPVAAVLEYLGDYTFCDRSETGGPGLDSDGLIAYIKRLVSAGELTSWNVALPKLKYSDPPENRTVTFGGLKMIPLQRSRLAVDSNGYKVGVLSSPEDLKMDLVPESRDPFDNRVEPLLLVYRIWKDSMPRRSSGQNGSRLLPLFDSLDQREDVVGLAFVFPQSAREPYNYVGQVRKM